MYTYHPSDARAVRSQRGDDVRSTTTQLSSAALARAPAVRAKGNAMARWRGHRRCLASTTLMAAVPPCSSSSKTCDNKAAQQQAAAEAAEEEPTALTPTVAKPAAKAARERLCIRRRLRLQLRDSTPKWISWAVPWSRPGARYAYGCDTGEWQQRYVSTRPIGDARPSSNRASPMPSLSAV